MLERKIRREKLVRKEVMCLLLAACSCICRVSNENVCFMLPIRIVDCVRRIMG